MSEKEHLEVLNFLGGNLGVRFLIKHFLALNDRFSVARRSK